MRRKILFAILGIVLLGFHFPFFANAFFGSFWDKLFGKHQEEVLKIPVPPPVSPYEVLNQTQCRNEDLKAQKTKEKK